MDLCQLTSSELLERIRSRVVTVEDVVTTHLNRIRERQPEIAAWIYINEQVVLEQARQLDLLPVDRRGPLHGLPIGVKDVMLTKDMPTCYNSPAYASNHPEVDAASIAILRAAGALILGKTQTTQFAATLVGTPCANPHDTKRTPGGSSSGSAAAVADFQVPLALGTQTVGSVVRPSSFTGIVGFKPTWGAVSTEGIKLSSATLDTFGVFSRSVKDLDLILSVFQLADTKTVFDFSLRGSKFGVCRTAFWRKTGPGTKAAIETTIRTLREAGAVVEELSLPAKFDSVTGWQSIIQAHEARVSFLNERINNAKHLAQNVLDYWDRPLTKEMIIEAYDGVAALRPVMDAIASNYSAVLAPSAIDEAPVGLDHTGEATLNAMWTVLHVPVINIPGLKGENGLPIGISLISSRYNEQHLLRVASAVAAVLEDGGAK